VQALQVVLGEQALGLGGVPAGEPAGHAAKAVAHRHRNPFRQSLVHHTLAFAGDRSRIYWLFGWSDGPLVLGVTITLFALVTGGVSGGDDCPQDVTGVPPGLAGRRE
jgi:hypothetical protein